MGGLSLLSLCSLVGICLVIVTLICAPAAVALAGFVIGYLLYGWIRYR